MSVFYFSGSNLLDRLEPYHELLTRLNAVVLKEK